MQFFIETPRLIMRDILPTDHEGMFRLDSDPEVHKYLGGKTVQSMDEVHKVIAFVRQQYIDNGIGRWAVIEKSTGDFIGWSGLKYITEPVNNRMHYYDLGYRLIKDYWGKGYASETAVATIQYAWEVMGLSQLWGLANVENKASRRVLEKMGMLFQGTFIYPGDIETAWYILDKH